RGDRFLVVGVAVNPEVAGARSARTIELTELRPNGSSRDMHGPRRALAEIARRCTIRKRPRRFCAHRADIGRVIYRVVVATLVANDTRGVVDRHQGARASLALCVPNPSTDRVFARLLCWARGHRANFEPRSRMGRAIRYLLKNFRAHAASSD